MKHFSSGTRTHEEAIRRNFQQDQEETGAMHLVVVIQNTLFPALLPALPSFLSIWIPVAYSSPHFACHNFFFLCLSFSWHYFTAFYQPEPWIKFSSGKNLITFKITRDLGGGSMATVKQQTRPKFYFHFCHFKLYDLRQVTSHFWASLSSSENEIEHK